MIQVGETSVFLGEIYFFPIDDSDNVSLKRKPSKKRARYELDEDFDASDGKNGDRDFVPSRRRYVSLDISEFI